MRAGATAALLTKQYRGGAGPLDLSEALRCVVLFGSWHLRMHVVRIPDEVDGADWALLQTHRSQEHRHQGVARRLSRSALSVCHPISASPRQYHT